MIFGKMDQCLLSIVKEDNPWDVSSLYDFNYYCCPECDSKSQNKQDFINHASNNHPWALDNLRQITDGSLDDVEFPDSSLEVKEEEGEDYELPEDLMEMDMVDENAPLRKKRAKKIFICQICSKSFKDNYKLKRHKKVHIRSGEIPEPTEIISSEVDKLEMDKPIEDKKDIEIPAETNQDNSVEKVMKPKRTKKNFQCKECNKSFRDNYKLKRHEKVHMKMKLPEKTLDGQNLGEAYDSYLKDFFKYESAIIKDNGKVGLKYSCLICLPVSKVLVTQKNPIRCLAQHMKSVHPQLLSKFDEVTQNLISSNEPNLPSKAPFNCPDCQEEFLSYETLKTHWQDSHKLMAKNESSVLCNLCGKTFLRKDAYKRHMWSDHRIGKPQEHECDICGKKIQGVKSNLLTHKLLHKGTKDHVCHICGAGFIRPTSLRYHTQRVHEHSGKYACMYCDYKTVIPKHLDVHVNAVHTKAIKYSCDECNFSCYTKGNLTAHKRTVHLKLKPHKCPVCPEAYVRRSELEKHLSIAGH